MNQSSSSDYSRCVWDLEDSPISTLLCRNSFFSRLATSQVISELLQELDDDLERIGTCSPPPPPPPQSHHRQSMDNSIIERVDQNDYYPLRFIGRGCYSDVYMVTQVTQVTTPNHTNDDNKKEQEQQESRSRSRSSEHVAFKSLNTKRIPNSSELLIAADGSGHAWRLKY